MRARAPVVPLAGDVDRNDEQPSVEQLQQRVVPLAGDVDRNLHSTKLR